MNIRNAILAAADHIAANPSSYAFHSNYAPSCGTPGCMMGWIGFHMGIEAQSGWMGAVRDACGFDYCDLGDFARTRDWYNAIPESYTSNAAVAARVMRDFADHRFPAKVIQFPDWRAMASGSVPADADGSAVQV